MCDKRRELRKKRFKPEGSEKYKEVNNNIKRCMEKAKENWVGEQCGETEENLRKSNSKRAYQLVKELTTVKQGKATTVEDRSGKCLTKKTGTEPMDRILLWAVQSQGQWRAIRIGLSPHRHGGNHLWCPDDPRG